MTVLTIALVSGAISGVFYYVNRESATSIKKLREYTAMVFVLSASVMMLAMFLGIGGEYEGASDVGIKSSGSARDHYIIGGEPPF